jgi:hypothetical protein
MKRYRIIPADFDLRINQLHDLQKMHNENPTIHLENNIISFNNQLIDYYGERRFEQKLENLKDIGSKHYSIISYHNLFIEQIRESFINENYYPSLVSACALGERVLNHLTLDLREFYTETPEYLKIKDKKTYSNWNDMIEALKNWEILLPEVSEEFHKLKLLRHKSVHFNENLYKNLRPYALEAINSIQEIIYSQFCSFGNQPWFITSIPGERYIKLEYETKPFIEKYFLPNCVLVGYENELIKVKPPQYQDCYEYEKLIITDEKFSELRRKKINTF